MMYKTHNLMVALILFMIASLASSCKKEEYKPYDNPFIHIHQNERSEVRVRDNRNETVSYYVYLSAKKQFKTTVVHYEITTGEGLKEGRDYELLTPGNELVFAPGITEMPIAIRWMQHAVEKSKNNTLTIQIKESNRDFNIGLPGPDQLQTSLTITKY